MKSIYVVCVGCPYITNNNRCLKIGGVIGICGHCGEGAEDQMVRNTGQRPRKLYKYYRKKKYKRRLERLADASGYYPCGAYRVGCDGYWVEHPEDTCYVKRCYRGRRSKYLKQVGNRRVRRYKGYIPNNGGYKKVFDFWWELT